MLYIFVVVYVLCALATDLKFRKVYNLQVAAGLLLGLGYSLYPGTELTFVGWILGVLVALLCLVPMYLLKGIAAGDVKLLMAIGGLLGYPTILDVLVYTFLFGGFFALAWVLYCKKLKQLLNNLNLMLISLFVSTSLKVSIKTEAVNQQSLGRMPYVTAIAASVCYVVLKNALRLKY